MAMREYTSTTSTVFSLLGDHLGSTSVVATSTGTLHSKQLYKPWGETWYTSGTLPTNYQYTGQQVTTIGLYFYGSRFYAPSLGRFVQADTIMVSIGNPMTCDRYAYSNNNPVIYVDPSGHWGISFSTSLFPNIVNLAGSAIGITNTSELLSSGLSSLATVLDVAALTIDTMITTADIAAGCIGFTGGAAIAIPGGEGPAVVTGPLGASVGVAMTELAAKPALFLSNLLSSGASASTIGADVLKGDTKVDFAMNIDLNGFTAKSNIKIGSGTHKATTLSYLGYPAPTGFMSLPIQAAAVASDFGIIKLPPVKLSGLHFTFISIKENPI